MAYEQRDMSGSLFRNQKKDLNDPSQERYPDYEGSCMVDGVEYWQKAWIKTARDGKKWMSFSYRRKEEKPARDTRPVQQKVEEDVPF